MNHYFYAMLALDAAQERSREAEARWLERTYTAAQPSRASRLRRRAALVLASFSRGTATVVRQLDECVADDLGRTLSPAD